MHKPRRLISLVPLLGLLLALALILYHRLDGDLVSVGPGAAEATPPPAGTIVIEAGAAGTIAPPFEVTAARGAARGDALAIPDGSASPDNSGRAIIPFAVAEVGTYAVWVRARWADACGNSVALGVDEAPTRTVGQNAVYGVWHWVSAGDCQLEPGPHRLVICEREDGVAVDQILLVPEADFRPSGPAVAGGGGMDRRRFADSFDRSPGHGLGTWEVGTGEWQIKFSLDPNRIPNQYALLGRASVAGEPARIAVGGPPWHGVRLAVSVSPVGSAAFGVSVGDARVTITVDDEGAMLRAEFNGGEESIPLAHRIRAGQWHRLVVERWASVACVTVDGDDVWRRLDVDAAAGELALYVAAGEVAFDDVAATEIAWREDGPDARTLGWRAAPGARWYRPRRPDAGFALLGRRGELVGDMGGMALAEVLVDDAGGSPANVTPHALRLVAAQTGRRLLRASQVDGLGAALTLAPSAGEARIGRIAARGATEGADMFRIGPYHFSTPTLDDPSDYLDFTDEEYQTIASSPDADKLERKAKQINVVGGGNAVWRRQAGTWVVRDGALFGTGPGAAARHWHGIRCALSFTAKLRLRSARDEGAITLYDGPDDHTSVSFGTAAQATAAPTEHLLHLALPDDGRWHEIRLRADEHTLRAAVDGRSAGEAPLRRGTGGDVRLTVRRGQVAFDDVEMLVPRRGRREWFCAFDRRETDWWREGGTWLDHGGIACAMASNWISLVAPQGEGFLWHKQELGANLLVAFSTEENSAWYGWHANPSHTHFPADNIRICVTAERDPTAGYMLEVNGRERTATVLYRAGQQVAAVPQDASFPLRYVGGHAPYSPRRNSMALVKIGGDLQAFVNGVRVLRFRDPRPLATNTVGIGGHHTRVNFSRIEVRELP